MKKIYDYVIEYEKINYNPIVLSKKLFYTVKHKTGILGLWKDSKGKIYKDYIKVLSFPLIKNIEIQENKKRLFKQGEKAVFYKNIYNEGIIEDSQGDIIKLKNQKIIYSESLKLSKIKELLNQHGGVTVYRLEKGFLIEIYQ